MVIDTSLESSMQKLPNALYLCNDEQCLVMMSNIRLDPLSKTRC